MQTPVPGRVITMMVFTGMEVSKSRVTETPGGRFFIFKPYLFKGESGRMIMVEEAAVDDIKQPLVVKEKTDKNGKKYFVVRRPRPGEEVRTILTLKSGGNQDHRTDRGHFKINDPGEAIVICDISSYWGDNHLAIVALKEGDCLQASGNHGSGFKRRNPQPNFCVNIDASGKMLEVCDLDVD